MRIEIKKLMLISGSLFAVALGFINVTSFVESQQLQHALHDQKSATSLALDLKDIRFDIVQIQQFLTDVGATLDEDGFNQAKAHFESAKKNLTTLAEHAPHFKNQVLLLNKSLETLYDRGVTMANAYIKEGREAGNLIMKEEETGFDSASKKLTEDLEQMATKLNNEFVSSSNSLTAELSTSNWMSILFNMLIMVGGIVNLGYLYFKVTSPLAGLKKSLCELNSGKGDLTRRIPVSENNEIGDIVKEFNKFIEHLQMLMRKVATSIAPVVNVAQVVAKVSEETGQGARNQQSETDKVATAVNEMTSTVTEVAKNAAVTMQATEEAEDKSNIGQKVVSETIAGINNLASEVNRATDVIQHLEEFSREIGSVLTVIREIADQTNLLALNAAIEAARAGEQGRGFAVVADEVRNLAGKTQKSTEQIQSMVGQLQSATSEAVQAMTQSHTKAQESVEQASKAGEALTSITQAIATISDMNAQIATSAEEQAAVAEEINRNVIAISEVADSTVGYASKTSSESGSLVLLAEDLEQVIKQFKI